MRLSPLEKGQHQVGRAARQSAALLSLLLLCHMVGCAAISGTIPSPQGPLVPFHTRRGLLTIVSYV
jgi:hypothetical protein